LGSSAVNAKCMALLLAMASFGGAQPIQFAPVSQDIIYARLKSFSSMNLQRETTIRELFEEVGCGGDSISEVIAKGVKETDVVCTKGGNSDSTIIVGAHFDKVDAGDGVVDNWSGASLLPSLYQGLVAAPRSHTFVFVAFAGEEKGLLGSKAYVKQLGKDIARIKAMVNMDTLGLSDTKMWVSHADKDLATWLGSVAATMKLPVAAVNVEKVGSADSESFRERKIPAITVHSVTQDTWPILHSPRDTMAAIQVDAYYRTYQLVLGYLAYLDYKLQ
jgi:Zn-dependent M28 family amino/carboxypeptidase